MKTRIALVTLGRADGNDASTLQGRITLELRDDCVTTLGALKMPMERLWARVRVPCHYGLFHRKPTRSSLQSVMQLRDSADTGRGDAKFLRLRDGVGQMTWSNQPAPVNAPIASRFQFRYSCRRVTEQHRYVASRARMNLYEVIFWGADGYDNDEDTIYLVRASDWRAAVEHVRINASPNLHKIHHSTLAHRVLEIGTDSSPFGEPQEQILRGPYFQCAYNRGWRAWDRVIVGADYTNDWKEETHVA